VIDEYSRECLAIDVARSIDGDGVVRCLDRWLLERGAPRYVRSDHGPGVIALPSRSWCASSAPTRSSLTRISLAKRLDQVVNGRLRDEYLNGQRFETLFEAQLLLEDWRIDYDMNDLTARHGWLTPVEFVEAWLNQQQLVLA